MKIIDIRAFPGPNIWHHSPVLRVTLDLEALEDTPTNRIERFTDRILTLLPGLNRHTCSEGHCGGFLMRLDEGTWMGHVFEHLSLELQNLAGADVGFGKTVRAGEKGIYNAIYRYENEQVGIAAARLALRIIDHIVYNRLLNFEAEMQKLQELSAELRLGPSTQAIVDEAARRNIPVTRLNNGSLIQLGYGIRQKRLQATMSSNTNIIATEIASDKQLTKQLLSDIGIPVPDGIVVETWKAAEEAMEKLGYPLVIKPADSNQGKACAINVRDRGTAYEAMKDAMHYSSRVLIETCVKGEDYRILVVNGEVVAAARRVPAHITGDGKRTIGRLVEDANQNPLRGTGHERPLSRIRMNQETHRRLMEQGFTFDSIPPAGMVVWLKYTANLSTGGTAIDCTDEVHPLIKETCVRAASVVGLDIAGIDILTSDISRPLHETSGVICEVNAAPGFRMHLHPTKGRARNVAAPVLSMLFPEGAHSRIPIVSITGTNGKTTTARMLAHILRVAGKKVGLACTDGIEINGSRIMSGDMAGPWSARAVLKDPGVDFAVLETARGGILRSGLGFDRCDVGVITNIAEDHLGYDDVETLEDLVHIKSLVLEVVKKDGYCLINAEDPRIVARRDRFRGRPLYFALDPENRWIKLALAERGNAAFLRNGVITVVLGGSEIPIFRADSIPATFQGKAKHQIWNALIAVASAACCGIDIEDIRVAMRMFQCSYDQSPGRANLERVKNFRVLLDYAHNAPALKAIGAFVGEIRRGRTTGIIGIPGDRRDEDVRSVGRIAAEIFDNVIVKEDQDRRGRAPGEIAHLLEQGIYSVHPDRRNVKVILNEVEAFEFALSQAKRNELIVVFCEKTEEVRRAMLAFRARHDTATAIALDDTVVPALYTSR